MPPKRASKTTLASHPVSSEGSNDDSSLDNTLDLSAGKKTRGRPRKQPVAASRAVEHRDDLVVPQTVASKVSSARAAEPPETMKAPIDKKGKHSANVLQKPAKPKSVTASNVPNRKKAMEKRLEIPETQSIQEADPDSDEVHSDLSDQDDIVTLSREDKPRKARPKKTSDGNQPGELADELTDQLAQLRLKYDKLRHLKTDEADAIHKEQIQALEERDRASQRIIENLKAELKSRSISFQQLQQKDMRIQELEEHTSIMEGKIERLLQDHAVLSAKLETARNSTKVPSHSLKTPSISGPTKEFSQHRDNLYSDLCGLIVVNVKSDEDGGIEYDCLSTGRNGALHFKLQLDAEDDDDETDNDDGPYFTYNPMLERGRDERLIAVLPPIFRDEMNFKRTRGVDFYLQLMQSLQSS